MQRPALGLLVSILAVLGCSTALDLERARALFERPARAEAPPLRDEQVALPAPQTLRVEPNALRALPLAWDPVLAGDVAGYVVERALEASDPFERIAIVPGRFATAFVDRGTDLAAKRGRRRAVAGLGDGESYHYRVRGFTSDGRLGATPSPVVQGETAPASEAPEDLRAFGQLPRRVALSWRAVPDPHVAGYVIERSPSAVGAFEQIARLEGRWNTTHEDRSLGSLRVFYYRVRAFNAAGGEGAASKSVRAVTKPEPLTPVGLAVAERSLGRNRLRWDPNVERDLARYRLLRWRDGADAPEQVAEVDAALPAASDDAVGAGERVSYQVVAIDADGLESAPSDRIEVQSVDYGLRAEPHGGGVRLAWDPAIQAELESARVIRRGLLRSRELGRTEQAEFVDRSAQPGRRYRYVVVGVRPDGTEAPASRPLEVVVPDPGSGA